MSETDQSLSILAARRAIAAIEDAIERIVEEGWERDPGGWYAMDRFQHIAEIARRAAEGREDAAYADHRDRDRDRVAAALDRRVLKVDGEPARPVSGNEAMREP